MPVSGPHTTEEVLRLVIDQRTFQQQAAATARIFQNEFSRLDLGNLLDFKAGRRTAVADIEQVTKAVKTGLLEALQQVGRVGQQAFDFGPSVGKTGDSFHKLAIEIKASVDLLARYAERTEAFERGRETARLNVQEASRQQAFRKDAQRALEIEKRLTDQLRFEQRKQIENLKQADSLQRITEQASQQRRLAKWTAFYKTVGNITQEWSKQMARTAGQALRRIFTRESQEFDQRRGLWRRNQSELTAIEENGERSRFNLLGRFFDRRRRLLQENLERESRLRTGAATGVVNDRLNRGVLGATVGTTALGSGVVGLGFAATGAIAGVLKVTNDFTASMKELKVASGATGTQMERLRQQAKDLGEDVKLPGVSAKDAADAMRILSVSGIKLNDIIGQFNPKTKEWTSGAQAVLQLSRATASSAEDSAKAVASGINVFKLSGKDAAIVADGLAVASTKSGASLSELNDALKQTGLSFASRFLPVEGSKKAFTELNAVLAVFAKNGLRGSDAGTSLKTMLQFLGGKSDDAKGMLSDLAKSVGETGTVLFDAEGKTRQFADVIRILRDGINKLPTAQAKAEFISKVFGTDASRAAEVLAGLNDKQLPKLIEQMGKQGAAAELAAAKNSGFKGGMDALGSTLETIGINIGEKIEPTLRKAAIGLSNFISNLATGDGIFKKIRIGLLGVAAALGVMIALKGASETFGLLRTAASALLASPFGLLALAFTAIAGAVYYFAKTSPAFRQTLKDIGASIQRLVSVPLAALSTAFQTAFGAVKTFIVDVIPRVKSGIADFVQGFSGELSKGENFWERFGVSVKKTTDQLRDNIAGIPEAFQEGFAGTNDAEGFLGIVQKIGTAAAIVQRTFENFEGKIGDILATDDSVLVKAQNIARTIAVSLDEALAVIGGERWKAVRAFIDQNVIGPVSRFFESITTLWEDSFGQKANRGILGGLLNFIEGLGRRLGRTLTAMVTDPNLLKAIGVVLGAAAIIALKAVQGFLSGVIEKLIDRLGSILNNIPIFGPLLKGIAGFGKSLSNIIALALIAGFAFKNLKGPLSKMLENVSGVVKGSVSAARFIDPDDQKRLTNIREQAARDVITEQRMRQAALRDKGTIAPAEDAAKLERRRQELTKERLVEQVGQKRANRILAADARQAADQEVATQKTMLSRIRKDNVQAYGAVGGAIANSRLQLNETSKSMGGFFRRLGDPSIRAKNLRAFDWVAPISATQKALQRLRNEDRLAAIQSKTARERSRFQPGGVNMNAQARQLEEALAAPRSSNQARLDALVGGAVRSMREARAGAARAILEARRETLKSLQFDDRGRFKKGFTGDMRAELAQVTRQLTDMGTKGTSSVGRLGGAFANFSARLSSAFTRAGIPQISHAIDEIARKVAKLPALVPRTGPSFFEKIFGHKEISAVDSRLRRTGGALQMLIGEKARSDLGRMGGMFQAVFGQKMQDTVGRTSGLFQRFFGTKIETDQGVLRTGGKIQKMFGEGREGIQNAVQVAETAVVGFFSGKAITGSSGIEGKLLGVVGAIGSIGAGFALGGPLGGGLAAAATLIGALTGKTKEAKAAQDSYNESVSELNARLISSVAEFGKVGKSVEANRFAAEFVKNNGEAIDKAAKRIPGLAALVTNALTTAGTTGDLAAALAPIQQQVNKTFKFKDQDLLDGIFEPGSASRRNILKNLGPLSKVLDAAAGQGFVKFATRGEAERFKSAMEQGLVAGVRDGSVNALELLDRFVIDADNTVRRITPRFGDENIGIWEKIGEAVSQATGANALFNSETGKAIQRNEELKAKLEQVHQAGARIKEGIADQNDLYTIQSGKLDILKQKITDLLNAGTADTATSVKEATDSLNDAARGISDALIETDDTGANIVKSFTDALNSDTDLGTSLRAAKSTLKDSWAGVVASVINNPEMIKDWNTQGGAFLMATLKGIKETAMKRGLSEKDAQALIADLGIPDSAAVAMVVKEATQESINTALGDTADSVNLIWDSVKESATLYLPIKPNPEDLEQIKRLAEALGLTLRFAGGVVPNRNPDVNGGQPGAPGSSGISASSALTAPTQVWNPFKTFTVQRTIDAVKAQVQALTLKEFTSDERRLNIPQWMIEQILANNIVGLVSTMFSRGGKFPGFARGDVVNRPTLGVFGEAGPEVIVPLSRPDRMIELLTQALAMTGRTPKFADGAIFAGPVPRKRDIISSDWPVDKLIKGLRETQKILHNAAVSFSKKPSRPSADRLAAVTFSNPMTQAVMNRLTGNIGDHGFRNVFWEGGAPALRQSIKSWPYGDHSKDAMRLVRPLAALWEQEWKVAGLALQATRLFPPDWGIRGERTPGWSEGPLKFRPNPLGVNPWDLPKRAVKALPPGAVPINPKLPLSYTNAFVPAPVRPGDLAIMRADMQDAALAEINRIRAAVGVPPVSAAPAHTSVALRHAQLMADMGGIFHTRDLHAGIPGKQLLGENVGYTSDSLDPTTAARKYLSSPAHYKNMIDRRWKVAGVGHVMRGNILFDVERFGQLAAGTLATTSAPAAAASVFGGANLADKPTYFRMVKWFGTLMSKRLFMLQQAGLQNAFNASGTPAEVRSIDSVLARVGKENPSLFGTAAAYSRSHPWTARGPSGDNPPSDLPKPGRVPPSVKTWAEQVAAVYGNGPQAYWKLPLKQLGPGDMPQSALIARANEGRWKQIALATLTRGGRFPQFAHGDIVNRPTLGVFGEAGPEVIVPLSKPKRMIELLSMALARTRSPIPTYERGAVFGGNTTTTTSTIGGTVIHEGDIQIYETRNARLTAREVMMERRAERFRRGQRQAR